MVALIPIVIAIALMWGTLRLQSWSTQTRTRKVGAVAANNHWTFSSTDRIGCTDKPFHVFNRGHDRRASNVCSFQDPDGSTLYVFDYCFTDSGKSTKTYRHSCALLEGRDRFPLLTIEHETVWTGLLDAVGAGDLQFESAEFNHTFRVTSDDQRFATAVIDARMMDFLLSHDAKSVNISLNDRYLLVWCDRLDPLRLTRFAQYTRDVLSHIPAVVRDLYPGY
jgi:hypothetical protein